MANTSLINNQIKIWTRLKQNTDTSLETLQKQLAALPSDDTETNKTKLKINQMKRKNLQTRIDATKKRSDTFQSRLDALNAKLNPPAEETPPEQQPSETPPAVTSPPPSGSGTGVAAAVDETKTTEDDLTGPATPSSVLADLTGRKGKAKTILTSPTGVMSPVLRMLRELRRTA